MISKYFVRNYYCRSFYFDFNLANSSLIKFDHFVSQDNNGIEIIELYNDDFRLYYIGSIDSSELLNYVNTQLNFYTDIPSTIEYFIFNSETCFYIIQDLNNYKLYYGLDYLGVQQVFYTIVLSRLYISSFVGGFNLYGKLSLKINLQGLINHFRFGYSVFCDNYLFDSIVQLKGSLIYFFNKEKLKIIQIDNFETKYKKFNSLDYLNIVNNFKLKFSNNDNINFGLTAGKDSFALLNLCKSYPNVKYHTFGSEYSSDIIVATEIADKLKLFHTKYSLVSDTLILDNLIDYVSFYSTGMCTASYVDMIYMFTNLPLVSTSKNYFVFGEGGECFRDFYKNDFSIFLNYITPDSFLKNVFKFSFDDFNLKVYVDDYKLKSNIQEKDFFLHYYRYNRMPGNFSLRNSIVQPLMKKSSPFLSPQLFCLFSLSSEELFDFNLHHKMGKNLDYSFFQTSSSFLSNDTQDWEIRFNSIFKNYFISKFNELLLNHPDINYIINFSSLYDYFLSDHTLSKRKISFLLRILSFLNSFKYFNYKLS